MDKRAASRMMLTFALLGMLALAFSVQLVEAPITVRKAGVNAGYWIKYGLSATWRSNDTEATAPQYALDSEQLAYFSNMVQSVIGTNITFNSVMHFLNGTETSVTRWVDADSGHAGVGEASGYLSFIAANLSVGDQLYTGLGPGGGQVNETIMRTYLGESVEMNHIGGASSSSGYFFYIDCYWHRATGALYEIFENHTDYDKKGETTIATVETTYVYVIGGVPDTTKPLMGMISIQPSSPTPEDDALVSVPLSDVGSGVKEAKLYYSIDGGSKWSEVSMALIGSAYEATIPRQNDGVTVRYYIEVFDHSMNKATSVAESYTVRKARADTFLLDPFLVVGIGATVIGLGVGAFLVQRKRRAHR